MRRTVYMHYAYIAVFTAIRNVARCVKSGMRQRAARENAVVSPMSHPRSRIPTKESPTGRKKESPHRLVPRVRRVRRPCSMIVTLSVVDEPRESNIRCSAARTNVKRHRRAILSSRFRAERSARRPTSSLFSSFLPPPPPRLSLISASS